MRSNVNVPRALVLLLALVAVPLSATVLEAHEIGTTRVSVIALDRSRYDLQVVTDATALLEKLEIIAGEEPSQTADPADLERRLAALGLTFQQRVTVSFGDTPVEPALTWSVAPPSTPGASPIATIRLTGEVPAAAGSLTFKYLWTFTTYSLTDRRNGENATAQWLEGNQTSAPLSLEVGSAAESRLALVGRYVVLGFTHILPKGLDHVLFVLGIFLVSRRLRPILLQVTAFTIAHSITLALSITGVVSLPSSIVEPAIAFSIAYLAIENVVAKDLRPWRYGMVFGFGLLHGLGFAGVLRELGLPPSDFLTALFGFNLGVELGQLTVIGAAFLLVGFWFRDRTWYRARVVLPASLMIACTGVYWTLERLNLIA